MAWGKLMAYQERQESKRQLLAKFNKQTHKIGALHKPKKFQTKNGDQISSPSQTNPRQAEPTADVDIARKNWPPNKFSLLKGSTSLDSSFTTNTSFNLLCNKNLPSCNCPSSYNGNNEAKVKTLITSYLESSDDDDAYFPDLNSLIDSELSKIT